MKTRYYTKFPSPIGSLYAQCDDQSITGLWFEHQKNFPKNLTLNSVYKDDHPILLLTGLWLQQYFSGNNPDTAQLPLSPSGTSFQKRVWEQLLMIPYGQTCTYKQLAERLGINKGAQAVGNAVGKNPIAIMIPCHRVVGSSGTLVGFSAGIQTKQFLLSHEI